MGKEKRPKPDDKEQSKRFIEKAREIGADQDAAPADELLGQLASSPPQPRTTSARKKRRSTR